MIGNIYINGCIGVWEGEPSVTLVDIVKQVKDQPEATSYNVYINSEGGFVDVGLDMFHYLRSLGKPITTVGTGIVASIATVIFMAGSVRRVSDNTQFMIHLPWQQSAGNADELEQSAKELRTVEKQLIDFYKKELNLTEEVIRPLLRDESWLTLEQLNTLGFTTEAPQKVAAKAFININKEKSMTQDDKSWFEKMFMKLDTVLKGKPKNKVVQDGAGAEIDFTDTADDATIEIGMQATIDGNPAEGEHVMPDGSTYVFTAGELTEIVPAEGDGETELDVANARIAELEAEIETNSQAHTAQLAAINTEYTALKARVKSSFKPDTKKPTDNRKPNERQQGSDRAAGAREYLNKKKGK